VAVSGVVIDTSILIRYLRTAASRRATTELAVALKITPCYAAYISVYELYFGATDESKLQAAEDTLRPLNIIGGASDVARRAGLLRRHLLRHGWDIGAMDALIAAACLEVCLPILSTNIDHFLRVPGLTVLSPDQIVPGANVEQLFAEARTWNADYRRQRGYDAIAVI